MAAVVANLTMVRGDTGVFKATANDETGAPIDDPGAEYRMTAKKRVTNDDSVEIFSVTATQSAPGVAYFTVLPSMTRPLGPVVTNLFYDYQITETALGSNPRRVSTIQYGTLAITPDVSVTSP